LRDHEGLRRSMSRLPKTVVGVSSVHRIHDEELWT
jgi:hypothetical protein